MTTNNKMKFGKNMKYCIIVCRSKNLINFSLKRTEKKQKEIVDMAQNRR